MEHKTHFQRSVAGCMEFDGCMRAPVANRNVVEGAGSFIGESENIGWYLDKLQRTRNLSVSWEGWGRTLCERLRKEAFTMGKLERVIVYSLLVAALFLGLRSNSQQTLVARNDILQEVRARSVVIVDDQGREMAVLSSHSFGGTLEILGPEGTTVGSVAALPSGGVVQVFNNDETTVGALAASARGGGAVIVLQDDGTTAAAMQAFSDGGEITALNNQGLTVGALEAGSQGGTVRIRNSEGRMVGLMGAFAEGGVVGVHNNEGLTLASLAALAAGGAVGIRNPDGITVGEMGSVEGGGIWLYNEQGHDRVALYRTTEGHGGIWVYDKDGLDSRDYAYPR